MDPNKAYLPYDPFESIEARQAQRQRTRQVQRAVRHAMTVLNAPERTVIEGYYFDGLSLPCLADQGHVSLARIRTIHTRALTKLRHELTPFVIAMYGLRPVESSQCPLCCAEWRDLADRLLDEKTEDMSWGQVNQRLERAVGWRAPTPQILITHQRKHRKFHSNDEGVL